ncbi:MAG: biopolymer transporter ExbD [Prevotella sp.]|jgi:biopolymer transport protein ExbD|nr:biopolymer transporter ExbD [Prevotella sp.]
MGKVKVKKSDVWIDMTPMSDVMVLLLTFFMMTSTFVKNEAVKVMTPMSVSEIKIPETNVMTVLVDKDGKIFVGLDTPAKQEALLAEMASQYGLSLTNVQLENGRAAANLGVAMKDLQEFLNQPQEKMNDYQKVRGIPTDSVDGKRSEFQDWVDAAYEQNGEDMKLAIKADAATPYKTVKKMMSELQDMDRNRYFLITSLKTNSEE